MWLKANRIDRLLAENRITRKELAREFDCDLFYINRIFEGNTEADEELSQLLIAAFGANEMEQVIDCRTAH